MEFRLTAEQKADLRGLDVLGGDRFEELIDILESHMSEAYVKEINSQSSPLLEARGKLIEIQRKTEKLSKDLKLLTPNDQYRIRELIGIHYHEDSSETSQSTRRRDLDIQKILSLLATSAASLVEDSKSAYGSRANDKAVQWLLEFWDEYVKLPIGQRYEKGAFVRFVAIILEKDPEAAAKLVTRFLQRQP